MRSSLLTISCLAASLALTAACGGVKKPNVNSPLAAAATDQATTALAEKLDLNPQLVNLAVNKAKSLLSGGADKTSAAQGGVEAAVAQAEAAGKPLNEDQKSGLLEGLLPLI